LEERPRQAGGEAGPRQAGGEAEPGRQTCAFEPARIDQPLSDEERRSALRLSGEDEVKALSGVLAFADARPELFKVLATDEDGSNSAVFETKLLATRLKNADTLSKLVARLAETRCADLRQRGLRRDAREKTRPARLRARQAVPDAPGEKG